ncbi:MAG: entericidin A/B family lipoprotein [Rickettsiaceae bacterium]|nr:MAG: entericidin A/B family lipoprotein [Rickettsiaceae bacterium]
MNSIITTTLIIITSLALSGCNTTKGLGKDIQRGGEKLENAADRAK